MINEETKFWFTVAQWITTVLLWLYVWNVNRNRVTDTRIRELEQNMGDKLDRHADRIARLEQDVRHAPSHEDLKRLHSRLDEVGGQVRELKGEFQGARHTLELIHQHMLDGGK